MSEPHPSNARSGTMFPCGLMWPMSPLIGVVVRAYRNLIVETVEELPVTLPDAVTASWTTVRDRLVTSPHPDMEGVVFRLVECTIGQTIYRLMTDRTDISTFQVILLYAYRWQIELIFRALKWTMNGVYVITEHEEGINSFFAALSGRHFRMT